jgi:hypothetical protein
MARKSKIVSYAVTVQIDIDEDSIDHDTPIEEELIGELVKIKSGFYENAAYGTILTVTKI